MSGKLAGEIRQTKAFESLEEEALLPARLRDLLNLKVATLIGCGL